MGIAMAMSNKLSLSKDHAPSSAVYPTGSVHIGNLYGGHSLSHQAESIAEYNSLTVNSS
jgi:hypothetical protein